MSTLTIAIPSKGRLQENTHAFFKRSGLSVKRPGGERNYRGRLAGVDGVEIAFLSASEIARELAAGSVHFGITGLDLLHETMATPETSVHLISPLGFGAADVVVAIPKAWIDVATITDFADMASDFRARHGRRLRVATKYVALTRKFFARHGIADYRIVESAGATEGAPAAGSAELIVDITSTGSTLTANNLKILDGGVILESQAHLTASLTANWSADALTAAQAILDRVAAEETARNLKCVHADVPNPEAALQAMRDLGAKAPFTSAAGGPLVIHCPARHVAECAAVLRAHGANTVTVSVLDYVFTRSNPLFDPLKARLTQV